MTERLGISGLALLITLAAAAGPAAGQACNGLPFRGRGLVAASYLAGDAADSPYALHEYGGTVVRQLPGWSPFATHHLLRFDATGGRASLDTLAPATGLVTRIGGGGGALGGSYTVDVLPGSYAGDYAICASAAVQGQWWNVGGFTASAVTVPVWLSFGGPLRVGTAGVSAHAGFGAYWRTVSGDGPQGSLARRGLRPWGDAGAGLLLGPARLDATVRHEFRTRQRVVVTFGIAP